MKTTMSAFYLSDNQIVILYELSKSSDEESRGYAPQIRPWLTIVRIYKLYLLTSVL